MVGYSCRKFKMINCIDKTTLSPDSSIQIFLTYYFKSMNSSFFFFFQQIHVKSFILDRDLNIKKKHGSGLP